MGSFQTEGFILRCLVNVVIQQAHNSISVVDSPCLGFAALALTRNDKFLDPSSTDYQDEPTTCHVSP